MYFFYFYLLSLFAVSFIVIFTHCSLTFNEKKKKKALLVLSHQSLFQSQGLGVGGPSSDQKEVLWDTQERITLLSHPEALRHWALLPPAFLASAL